VLAGPPDLSLEALKRAIFLGWYANAEPSCFTGVSDLHEGAVSLTHDLLRAAWAEGRIDEEFRAMLGLYWSMVPPCDFAGSPATDDFALYLSELGSEAHLSRSFSHDDLLSRGQMGQYWVSIVFRPAQQAVPAEGIRGKLKQALRLR
jgi:hypothetical protein